MNLRAQLAEQGVERTPQEVKKALEAMRARNGKGCVICNNPDAETRYGWCFPCFKKGGPEAEALDKRLKDEILGSETYITGGG